jgi:L-lactate dehydrogenase complex protein LldG
VSDARSAVLARIAVALGRPGAGAGDPASAAAGVERRYRRHDGRAVEELVLLFAERVADYGATVAVVEPGAVAAAVAAAAGSGRVLAAPAVDGNWLSMLAGAEVDSPPRAVAELDEVDTAVTACAVAVAETGTIVLDHRPDQGRRALTLVPDHHVCVVEARRLVATVPQAVSLLDPAGVLTWISGPSATSDIELDRVAGVHGPRRLDVVIARP